MFARAALRNSVRAPASARYFSQTAAANRKVAVLGASGGIGQPLSLLMKLNPKVTELRLYDIRLAPGVAADLSHINTPAVTSGYAQDDLEGAVDGAEIVLIPAGMPRKPGMTRDDLFNSNASIVRDLAKVVAKVAPKAYIGVISNPVNSTVPIVAEVFKKAGVYDPKRLFGVTTLDTTRAATFLSGIAGSDPQTTNVPVIGGHSGVTIVPLISQAAQGDKVQAGEQYDKLVHRIQFGGDEVVKAKDGAGSATLSMAYAAAVFTEGLLKGLDGEAVTQCTFVESPLFKDQVDFFASPVEFGPEGVKNIPALPKLTAEEQKLLDACLPDLAKNIKKGVAWAAENP
ncbi:malate dehydrogenase [Malassezia furfur]|uniref:Malate dehydrogenase n=1 Tax=Malassezia furfur TaxID=55194 RepID=Q9Y750_MALFU|nr:major allergenic protein Mal f4 [Malassezia furfur]WFD47614.1 malate dehydrogenase [Malassezia furfur]